MTMIERAVDERAAIEFLTPGRTAVIGASRSKGNVGAAVARALRDHGHRAVVVHPTGVPVDGLPAYRTLEDVPGALDTVVVVVPASHAAEVVRSCAAIGVRRVWLFRGIGGPGAVSEEALEVADAAGIDVVAGACPFMFLRPVGWPHRLHRAVRRRRGPLVSS